VILWGHGFPAMSRKIFRKVLASVWLAFEERLTAAGANCPLCGEVHRRRVLGDSA